MKEYSVYIYVTNLSAIIHEMLNYAIEYFDVLYHYCKTGKNNPDHQARLKLS